MRLCLRLLLAFFTVALLSAEELAPDVKRQTLIVYSASPAGISAALQAAKLGMDVIIIEESEQIGGSITNAGNCLLRPADQRIIGGTSKEFFDRIYAYYCNKFGQDSSQAADTSANFLKGSRFEPKAALLIFKQMLAQQSGIKILTNTRLLSVQMGKNKIIESVEISDSNNVSAILKADVFIDASYTADLAQKAKVKFAQGREAVEKYKESFAGFRSKSFPEKFGTADKNIQAFIQPLILTQRDGNKILIEKPSDYDPQNYKAELTSIKNKISRKENVLALARQKIPNGKIRFEGAVLTAENLPYSTGNLEVRKKIAEKYLNFAIGFIWFLQNDENLDESLRTEAKTLGIAKDEFLNTKNLPQFPVITEGLRMIGTTVLTQQDIFENRFKFDSIAVCATQTNAYPCSVIERNGEFFYEGRLAITPYPSFEIGYSAITPKVSECKNLLVATCVSASHVVWAIIAEETTFMALGQAAGAAAKIAAESKCDVQSVDIQTLKRTLLESKAVIKNPPEFTANFKWSPLKPKVGEAITFEHIIPKTKSAPVKFYWDFNGDGEVDFTGDTPVATHTFEKNKNHLVTLVVEDKSGRRSKCQSILVKLENSESSDYFLDTENRESDFCTFKTNVEITSANEAQLPYFGNNFKQDAKRSPGALYFEISSENLRGTYTAYLNTTLSGSATSKVIVEDDSGKTEVLVDFKMPENPYGIIKIGTFKNIKMLKATNDSEKGGVTIFDTYRFIKED